MPIYGEFRRQSVEIHAQRENPRPVIRFELSGECGQQPVSTSPVPPFAKPALPVVLTKILPSGAAMMV